MNQNKVNNQPEQKQQSSYDSEESSSDDCDIDNNSDQVKSDDQHDLRASLMTAEQWISSGSSRTNNKDGIMSPIGKNLGSPIPAQFSSVPRCYPKTQDFKQVSKVVDEESKLELGHSEDEESDDYQVNSDDENHRDQGVPDML